MKKSSVTRGNAPEPFFKGWAKPGPVPPGALDATLTVPENETLDAISGHFRLFQLRNGHRFSTDDVLTAWYGTSWCPSARTVLDLGSGIGSVGMIAAWRLQGARFVTVEAQAESVELAKKSAAYNGLGDRYEIRHGDFRDEGLLRTDEKFDLVLGSPPYFPAGTGIEGDHPQKIACRFELRGDIADYCRAAAAHLALGGFFACVFPHEQIERVESSARDAELAIIRHRPVVLKEGNVPLLCLFGMMLAQHLPEPFRGQTWAEPPLIIRRTDGSVHPEYSAIKLAIGFPP
jgi:tRNA1(Val) A37 N6-methylase TrmN6